MGDLNARNHVNAGNECRDEGAQPDKAGVGLPGLSGVADMPGIRVGDEAGEAVGPGLLFHMNLGIDFCPTGS